jgi:uncharacterized protein (UPF0335 family)
MTAGIGHNGGPPAHPDVLNSTAQGQIRSVIERVERLIAERTEINDQIKEVFNEAKGNGFDVAILRKVIRILAMDRAKRMEEEAVTDLYLGAAEGGLPTFQPANPKQEPQAAEPDDEDEEFA